MSDSPSAVVGADADLDMLCAEVKALRELAEQQPSSDRKYAFSIRWGALMFGRLERLEYYKKLGALSGDTRRRYDDLVNELRGMRDVMDELGVARPKLLLDT